MAFALSIGCVFSADFQMIRLPSGKQIKLLAVRPLSFPKNQLTALKLVYEADKDLSDHAALAEEADDIWELFQFDVERAGLSAAIISARRVTSGSSPQTFEEYSFLFRKDGNEKWKCTNKDVTPGSPAKDAYKEGLKLANLQKFTDALSFYDKSISLNPAYAPAYIDRGIVHLALKEVNKALDDFNKAISLNPDSAQAYQNRGGVLCVLKQYQDAFRDYDKALSFNNPKITPATYADRGELYVKTGEYAKGVEDLSKSIASNPNGGDTAPEAYHYRSIAYEKLGKPDLAKKDQEQASKLGYRGEGLTIDLDDHNLK
jgi:tetratricopeptide (TPR) repeat protein